MQPAARVGDMHTCPLVNPGPVPHVGGPIIKGQPNVLIGSMPAARISDMCVCTGPPDTIAKGSATVHIGGLPAARMGDMTAHGGVITVGCPTVLIGDKANTPGPAGAGGGSGSAGSASVVPAEGTPGLSPQATALIEAAETNTPFCEVCSKG